MPDDPAIQRVREARRRIQEECGNVPHIMSLWTVKEQEKHANRLACWNAQETRLISSKARRGKQG
jgi:hypothetical protein